MLQLVAKIAVSAAVKSIDKLYSYIVPADLTSVITVGQRVIVPFGRSNTRSHGFVIELCPVPAEECSKLKSIQHLYIDSIFLSNEDIETAKFIKNRYFCTFFEAANALLPPGVWSNKSEVFLTTDYSFEEICTLLGKAEKKIEIVRQIYNSRHPLTCAEIIKITGIETAATHLRQLIDLRYIKSEQKFEKATADKHILVASLTMPLENAEALIKEGKLGERRKEVLRCLSQAGSLPEKELCYMTGVTSTLVKGLEKIGVLKLEEVEVYRRPEIKKGDFAPEIVLSDAQDKAYCSIKDLLDSTARGALLYGVTGSGKTEIYIRLIQDVLSRGKNAILLVPEIALTPQMVRRFCLYFNDEVAIIHSALTGTQRYDEYKRIKAGKARIVVGTRSAVLAPLSNLGIIIVDEEHEYTYKSENSPRYHAVDVAKFRAARNDCLVLLGSATPSVETMHSAQSEKISLIKLESRYNAMPLPKTIISDMRGNIKNGNAVCIGKELAEEIRKNLERKEKTILFINRRGASNKLVCIDCGHIPTCERCSVSLVYHSKNERLLCHHCGYSEKSLDVCPVCGSSHLKYQGIGTQRVEDELTELFPDIKIVRMDADTIVGRTSHEKLLDDFANDEYDILLGTQMVAKGLDFESVTLVGVLDGDGFMYSHDFRAQERAFSLMTQVVGRAGRHTKPGRAVIQTYCPENAVILAAAAQDYNSFYSYELSARQALRVPPFEDIIVFTLTGAIEQDVTKAALSISATLSKAFKGENIDIGTSVLGPVPAAISKLNNKYRLVVSFRGKNNNKTRLFVERILTAFMKSIYSNKVSISADINPYNS